MKRRRDPAEADAIRDRNREARQLAAARTLETVRAAVLDPDRLARWAALGDGFEKAGALARVLQGEDLGGWRLIRPAHLHGTDALGTVTIPVAPGVSVAGILPAPGAPGEARRAVTAREALAWLVEALAGARVTPDGLSALAAVVEALRPVAPNERPDPILPAGTLAIPAAGVHSERRSLTLFGAGALAPPSVARMLPGFPDPKAPTVRIPAWLAAFDKAGGPAYSRTGGGYSSAPVTLRLGTEFLARTPLERRDHPDGSLMPFRVRSVVAWLRPRGLRDWRIGRHWPDLRRELQFFDSEAARVRWLDPLTGAPSGRRIVSLEDLPPLHGASLDSWIAVRTRFPPGAAAGPRVLADRLHDWGARSALAYRGLLTLAYYWHSPGRTRIPARGGHWLQVRDPERYDRLTDADLLALFYPSGEAVGTSGRRMRLQRIREVLRMLQDAGDVGEFRDRRVLPPRRMLGGDE